MRKWLKRILMSLAVILVIGYVGACVWLRANETRIAFNRRLPYVPPWPSLALNEQRVEFAELGGTKVFAWLVPSLPEDAGNLWLLFFHGTGDNVSLSANAYDQFRSMGFNVMAPEYPGYAGSPGEPSEEVIEREARAAYEYLRKEKRVPAKNIVIFGASLGSAVAVDLASHVDAGGLIVGSGFSSAIAIGQKMFPFLPMRLLLRTRFESDKKIGLVKMPILVIHSVDDRRVPLAENGQRLYDLAGSPKRLVKIHGEHGEGVTHATVNPDFFADIVTFLNEQAGFQLRRPLPSIAPEIAAAVERDGIEAALDRYRALRRETPARYNFREPELDHLGQDLLEKKRSAEAIAIFRLNAEMFPQSFRAFDSLADGYAASGKEEEAIESYRRSLALIPGHGEYIRAKLEHLYQAPGS
jgi:fermentation-respiration switch protein FrsA (DUF1100 family)